MNAPCVVLNTAALARTADVGATHWCCGSAVVLSWGQVMSGSTRSSADPTIQESRGWLMVAKEGREKHVERVTGTWGSMQISSTLACWKPWGWLWWLFVGLVSGFLHPQFRV